MRSSTTPPWNPALGPSRPEIRCLVCQNETIDSSNAELAREMRILVRERLLAGDSDDGVKSFLVDRYGDFVLFRPPLNLRTVLLWFGPLLLALLVLPSVVLFLKRQKDRGRLAAAARLSAEEEARLAAILAEGPDPETPESPRVRRP